MKNLSKATLKRKKKGNTPPDKKHIDVHRSDQLLK